MNPTRRRVFTELAIETDPEATRTAAPAEIADRADCSVEEARTHLDALCRCELAVESVEGRFRISITGRQLLSLGTTTGVVDLCSE